MIATWAGVDYANVPGVGWRPVDELTPGEAMLVLAQLERLMGRLAADIEKIQALARRKQEVGAG